MVLKVLVFVVVALCMSAILAWIYSERRAERKLAKRRARIKAELRAMAVLHPTAPEKSQVWP